MNNHLKNIAAAATLLFLAGTSFASANTITVGGGTTSIVGGYDLVANTGQPYSYVNVALTTPLTFSSIFSVSATFNDLLGGSAAGSPRIELDQGLADFFNIYLGPPPSFAADEAGLNAYSGVNLDNASGNTGHQNAGTYLPLSDWQALYGAYQITDFAFILERNSNVDQHLTLTALTVNGVNLLPAAAVPEPITLSLFGAGVAGAFAMRRRKAKKA